MSDGLVLLDTELQMCAVIMCLLPLLMALHFSA